MSNPNNQTTIETLTLSSSLSLPELSNEQPTTTTNNNIATTSTSSDSIFYEVPLIGSGTIQPLNFARIDQYCMSNEMQFKPFTVVVQGNPYSGRSEFIEYMQHRHDEDFFITPEREYTYEPSPCLPLNCTEDLKSNMQTGRGDLDMYLLLSSLRAQTCKTEKLGKLMHEWCDSDVYVKAKKNLIMGYIESMSYSIIEEWLEYLHMVLDLSPHIIVYIRRDPEKCIKIAELSNNPISLEELNVYHDLNDNMLIASKLEYNQKTIVIDGNLEGAELLEEYQLAERIIMEEMVKYRQMLIQTMHVVPNIKSLEVMRASSLPSVLFDDFDGKVRIDSDDDDDDADGGGGGNGKIVRYTGDQIRNMAISEL